MLHLAFRATGINFFFAFYCLRKHTCKIYGGVVGKASHVVYVAIVLVVVRFIAFVKSWEVVKFVCFTFCVWCK